MSDIYDNLNPVTDPVAYNVRNYYKQREAELREKLAGYEAKFKLLQAHAPGLDAMTPMGRASRDEMWKLLRNIDDAELRKLLESKVSEGWQLVPKEVVAFWSFCKDCFVPFTSQHEQLMISLKKANAAMLSAQPKEPKQ